MAVDYTTASEIRRRDPAAGKQTGLVGLQADTVLIGSNGQLVAHHLLKFRSCAKARLSWTLT